MNCPKCNRPMVELAAGPPRRGSMYFCETGPNGVIPHVAVVMSLLSPEDEAALADADRAARKRLQQ